MNSKIDIRDKCNNNNNKNQTSNGFCLTCGVLVCQLCANVHTDHKLNYFNDHFKLIESKSKVLVEELEDRLQELEESKDAELFLYENKIKSINDKEKEALSAHFRELHDSLHIKEVELKRELDSYCEDNQENYIKVVSNYDEQINQLKQSISQLKLTLSSTSNEHEDSKINLVNSFMEIDSKPRQVKNDSLILYKIGQIETQIKKTQDSINFLQFSVNSIRSSISARTKYSKKNYYLYTIAKGLQSLDLISNDAKELIPARAVDAPVKNNSNYFFFQDNSEVGYLFNDEEYWAIKNIDDTHSFRKKPATVLKSYEQSTIYDGIDHIYIVGGWNGSTSTDHIIKFNIRNESFEALPIKLQAPLRACSLSIDNTTETLYIFGGYSSNEQSISIKERRIWALDLKNLVITTITEDAFGLKYKNVQDYHFSGCYVPKNDSFYISVDGTIYQKPRNSEPVQLGVIRIKDLYSFVKFMYDGFNTISIVNRYSTETYEIDVVSNQFFKTSFKFENPIDIDDYITLY